MKINGIGSALVDRLYSPVDFSSPAYRKWTAENTGGTGIITGGLIFMEDLEKPGGKPYSEILAEITGGTILPKRNIGGPSIVSLIHILQVLGGESVRIGFFGVRGDDDDGIYLQKSMTSFGIDTTEYRIRRGRTPCTDVLIDPRYKGSGERSFINVVGVAGGLTGKDLPSSFFDADVLLYGGTALTTGIHDDLGMLLERGHSSGCLNFVNTVYDFRNEKLHPRLPWPLVKTDRQYRMVDLLIADREEAQRISGQTSRESALEYFISKGVGSVIITEGTEDVICYSRHSLFSERGIFSLPVSEAVGTWRLQMPRDTVTDTTGCGDNFAGGVYASALQQLGRSMEKPSLKTAAAWGIVSGGFASLYTGGVYHEKRQGEKRKKMEELLEKYREQTDNRFE